MDIHGWNEKKIRHRGLNGRFRFKHHYVQLKRLHTGGKQISQLLDSFLEKNLRFLHNILLVKAFQALHQTPVCQIYKKWIRSTLMEGPDSQALLIWRTRQTAQNAWLENVHISNRLSLQRTEKVIPWFDNWSDILWAPRMDAAAKCLNIHQSMRN